MSPLPPARPAPAFTPVAFDLEVEPLEEGDEAVALRFKVIGAPQRLTRVYLEIEGLGGYWRIEGLSQDGRAVPAHAAPIEDSSDGTALLVHGGACGLRLVHEESSAVRREPYLVLALGTERG